MSAKKVLVVLGATGNQGGSVVQSIVSDPKAAAQFHIKAVTRDPTSAKAQKLHQLGDVEPIKAELNDKESLVKAFTGADAVYAVTDFWSIGTKDGEFQQGKNIADAAKEAGVKHLLWSALDSVSTITKGRLPNVYHFDSKAEVTDYIKSLGIPATIMMAGCYMSNVPSFLRPDEKTGVPTLYTPIPTSTKVPWFAASEDTGKFVKAVLLNREANLGKTIRMATVNESFDNLMKTLNTLRPKAAKGATVVQIPRDAYKGALAGSGMPDIIAEDMTQMWEFMENPGYFQDHPLSTDILVDGDKATTWEEFVEKTDAWKE